MVRPDFSSPCRKGRARFYDVVKDRLAGSTPWLCACSKDSIPEGAAQAAWAPGGTELYASSGGREVLVLSAEKGAPAQKEPPPTENR
ncbi:MAG: hypothetical protein RDV48_26735 [Candidatus Eremiobacteraeota bacterium]|nr:hypothetical protein [Candidatus Eremiobacteraeota bacterium]